jgi:hypothetical protein
MFTAAGGFDSGREPKTGKPRTSKEGPGNEITLRNDRIYVHPEEVDGLPEEACREHMLHELAHFVGPPDQHPDHITDHAYMHVNRSGFFMLSPHKSLRNADCYSIFVFEAALGREPICSYG